ncbi:serine carboxypeptidase-like [Musa troglodytarum]|uniref:Serine carboxypeptidase-like n=1 Tax=Musa troglodytarum TaxID=320322 RepID=A0A9E7ES17_9LILI|nr:serine carboxypeptidase-like [Musa troglodytarum]
MAAAAVRELLLSFSSAALLLLLLFLAQQPPVSSLNVITHLPGFEGPLPFHLETGYVDVDEANGVQLFYYFIRSERKPADDPLMVWITGGPGCSAFSGLMYEIGPLQFDVAGYTFGLLPSLIYNPISWTKVSSIIFLDSPVGTGFSYSSTEQGSLITDTKSAIHVCTFLKKGYLVGNPSTDGEYDGNAIIPYVHGMGLISDELYEATKRSCGGQYQSPGNAECASCLQAVSQGLFGINNVHILEPLCFFASPKRNILTADRRKLLEEHLEQPLSKSDLPLQCRVNPFLFLKPKLHFRLLLLEKKNPCVISGEPSYQSSGYVLSYFWANNDTVREALGVREGTKQMWVRCNYGINYTNDVPSSLKYHLSLTSRGYRALAYSGDHDMSVPFVGTQAWIRSLNFSIVDDWRSWFVDGQVAGFTRSYSNNLTFVTIKGAGHTAPEYKPKECLAMVDRWFAGSPL